MGAAQMTKTAITGATIDTRFAVGLLGAGCGLVGVVAEMALVDPNSLAILRSPRKTNLQGQQDQEQQCNELCHEVSIVPAFTFSPIVSSGSERRVLIFVSFSDRGHGAQYGDLRTRGKSVAIRGRQREKRKGLARQ